MLVKDYLSAKIKNIIFTLYLFEIFLFYKFLEVYVFKYIKEVKTVKLCGNILSKPAATQPRQFVYKTIWRSWYKRWGPWTSFYSLFHAGTISCVNVKTQFIKSVFIMNPLNLKKKITFQKFRWYDTWNLI